MAQRGLIFVFLAALAWGQSGVISPTPQPPAQAPSAPEPEVAPDAPVITIEGVCDPVPADKSQCKTIVTKAEFENAIKAIQPTIPPPAQRSQFARRYATLMIFADQAHKQGLDKGPKFEEQMKLTRMEVAARTLGQDVQEKASAVSDAEVSEYFQAHSNNFEQVDVQQIFVPHAKEPTPPAKSATAPAAKAASPSEEAVRKEVEGLYKRAAAGEDFAKLQTEAYAFSGLKTKPPETKVTGLKRATLTPNRAVVFDLKPGEVSKVVTDPTGYFIYKLDKKETVPLASVRAEIENALKTQKMQAAIKSMEGVATPKYDDKYFGTMPGPGTGGAPGMAPAQPPMRPAPDPAQPPKP